MAAHILVEKEFAPCRKRLTARTAISCRSAT